MDFNTLIPNHELEVLREKARKWDNITDERITFIAWRTAEQWEQFKADAELGEKVRKSLEAHKLSIDGLVFYPDSTGFTLGRLEVKNG